MEMYVFIFAAVLVVVFIYSLITLNRQKNKAEENLKKKKRSFGLRNKENPKENIRKNN